MSDHPTDEAEVARDLVLRIHGGDGAAETALVERYGRGLVYLLRHRTGNPALADDLHQETFAIVLTRLRASGLDEPARLAGFLRRTALNLAIADHRKRARRRTDCDEATLERAADPAADPHAEAVRREDAARVRRLVAELPAARDREVLYRVYLLEQERDRICADLGLTPEHLSRVLYRARQRFRELLEAETTSR